MKNRLELLFEENRTAETYARAYGERMREILASLPFERIAELVGALKGVRDADGTLFLAGNGGSAAVCSHFANDLGAMASEGGKLPLRAMSLTDNTPFITALANDTGFDNVFVHQLKPLFRERDALLVISGSGNSENLLRAVRFVNERGGLTLGILGFDGGILKSLCRFALHIETDRREYGPAEDLFMIVGHMVSTFIAFDMGLFGKPPSHPCHRTSPGK
jgi:D-sedoheptulose 7-phosphate isomerase